MTVTIRIDGGREFRRALASMSEEVREEVSKAVMGTALELQGDVKQRIARGNKSGTTYYRIPGDKYMTVRAGAQDGPPVAFIPGSGSHNLSPVHTASAPNQSPASDTGRLANSINFDVENDLTAVVGSNLIYAVYLEYGTRKIRPRPFFEPAVEAIRPKFGARLVDAIRKATK